MCLLLLIVQEMQERMPSDPFEAELLMMAEAVASGGARGSESDSDASEDAPDNCKHSPFYWSATCSLWKQNMKLI